MFLFCITAIPPRVKLKVPKLELLFEIEGYGNERMARTMLVINKHTRRCTGTLTV